MKKLIALLVAVLLLSGAALAETADTAGAWEKHAASAMSEFNGWWKAVMMDPQGMQLSLADMGMAVHLMIDDGYVTMLDGLGNEQTELEGTCTMAGGELLLDFEGVALRMYLYQDGRAAVVQEQEGMTAILVFERLEN